MKSTLLKFIAIVAVVLSGLGFTFLKPGSITGKIKPVDEVKDVWAVSAKDTVIGMVNQGGFTIAVARAGTYTVIINATKPYKSFTKEGITVTDEQPVDLGEITLEK